MQKALLTIAISLAACLVAAAIVLNISPPGAPAAGPLATGAERSDARIAALEAAIAGEREARQMLEEQILMLYADLERLETGRENRALNSGPGSSVPQDMVEEVRQFRGERPPGTGVDRMLEAGITPQRADWILQREEELRFAAMQARFDARNSDTPADPFDPRLSPEAMLRAELGEVEYEKYLAAYGRSTSVAVSNVLASSPAARAGLQPGDEIVSYNGQRVYNTGDLIRQTMQPGAGNVVVDVRRDGAELQVVLPRGPIGVETGRFRRR